MFFGYNITTSIPSILLNPLATAPPVSPDVATRTVIFSFLFFSAIKPRNLAMNLAPTSLNARVGP